MRSSHTEDSIDEFTLELLRSGYALTQMATDVADILARNASCGEDASRATLQMINATIRSFLDETPEPEVIRATDLISGAMDRVVEHLQLALELGRQTDDRDRAAARGWDDPDPEAGMTDLEAGMTDLEAGMTDLEAGMTDLEAGMTDLEAGMTDLEAGMTDAAEILAGAPELPDGPAAELADALVYCGGLLSQVVAQMVRSDGGTPEGEVPIPDSACRLIAALLRDLDCLSDAQMAGATEVVEALTESLTRDVYFVDPGYDDQ